MFHLAAYVNAALGNTADTDIAALTDDILTVQNTHFVLSQEMQLIGAYAGSATITRAKIASPTMRQIASPFIRPVHAGATPGSNTDLWLLDQNPFRIPAFEEIQVQATSGVAMTEVFTAALWLQDVRNEWPIGNVYPLRATSTTAAVANAWTSVTLTWADTVPAGIYAMVLSECISTNGQFHRWIFSGQTFRPGFPSFTAGTQRLPYAISKGQFGVMGRFRSNDLPRLQVLCNGADASHTVFAHCVKVGSLAA